MNSITKFNYQLLLSTNNLNHCLKQGCFTEVSFAGTFAKNSLESSHILEDPSSLTIKKVLVNTSNVEDTVTSPPKTPRSKRKQIGAKKCLTPFTKGSTPFAMKAEDLPQPPQEYQDSETSTSPSSHIPSLEDCSELMYKSSTTMDESSTSASKTFDETGSGCSTLVQSMENVSSALRHQQSMDNIPSLRPDTLSRSQSTDMVLVPSPSPRIKKRARKEQLLQQHKLFGKDVLDKISKESSN